MMSAPNNPYGDDPNLYSDGFGAPEPPPQPNPQPNQGQHDNPPSPPPLSLNPLPPHPQTPLPSQTPQPPHANQNPGGYVTPSSYDPPAAPIPAPTYAPGQPVPPGQHIPSAQPIPPAQYAQAGQYQQQFQSNIPPLPGGPQYGQGQFAQPQAPRKSKAPLIIGCITLPILFCCISGIALIWFGAYMTAQDVKQSLSNNSKLTQHIGTLQDLEIQVFASLTQGDSDTNTFNVTGSKGSGVLTVTSITQSDGTEKVTKAVLTMPDGTTHDIVP
jgi:hypothetical protein